MKTAVKYLLNLSVISLFLVSGITTTFGQKAAREQLDNHTQEVNKAAKKQGMELSLQRVATETGVPLDQVQAMHKKYSDTGAGGLLIACVLANETKKAPEDFLKRHASDKSWAAIARDNNVSFDKLNERLTRLENAIGTGNEKKNRKHKAK